MQEAEIDLAWVLRKRLRIIGSVLRSRSLAGKIAITQAFKERIWPLFQQQRLQPVSDSIYPLAGAELAHAHVAANENFGKVALQVTR